MTFSSLFDFKRNGKKKIEIILFQFAMIRLWAKLKIRFQALVDTTQLSHYLAWTSPTFLRLQFLTLKILLESLVVLVK